MLDDPTQILRDSFDRLLAFAGAQKALEGSMPSPPKGRTYVLAIGKAAASMAQAFEARWPSHIALEGIALTRYNHAVACQRIEVVEASHPVPDNVGQETARRVVRDIQNLTDQDLLVCLISGGGSALLSLPVHAVPFAEKQSINSQLLASGVPIDQMNCVRKHISAVKGGRLAALARPAKVHTIAISDVPGNDISVIASGPTVPDQSTRHEALAIVQTLPNPPASILKWLKQPQAETPKAGAEFDADLCAVSITPEGAFANLIQSQQEAGLDIHYLGADIQGEASTVAREHANLATVMAKTIHRPTLLLSGGETTVTIDPETTPGRGGRNCEYLLALFCGLQGHPQIHALAADTDGIDGSEDNAGALFTPNDWHAAAALDIDPAEALTNHDSYSLFQKLDRLLTTGPTRTNINDFRALYITPLK